MKFGKMDATLVFDRDRMFLNDIPSGTVVTVCYGDRLAVLVDGVHIGTCYGQFFCYLGFREAEVHLEEDGEIQLEVKSVRKA